MSTPLSTITAKGQTTVPSSIRKALNLTSNSRIAWVALRPGEYTIIPLEKKKKNSSWAEQLCGKYASTSFDGVQTLLDTKKEDIKRENR